GPKLTQKGGDGRAAPTTSPITTPPWTLDARFVRALLANGESASDILANASGGGEAIRWLDIVGTIPGGGPFSVRIEPGASTRHLSVEARDAGRFLRGVDSIRGLQSGHLAIEGDLDSNFGLEPLVGTALLENVVLQNSPLMGKLLQAITVYGLVDALRGPGITFSRIVAPFKYDGADVTLNDAHASNASLGLTAKGRVGLSSGLVAVSGTIVPAYYFNSMLGQLPVVGKVFSPEKGGGVFAARFSLDGSIDDPSMSLNPVSALTPGFMRDIFGIFDRDPPASSTIK
ncbi:MAG TPA: AsmA-like C-terminal region-containing protein, partial [Acidobacteriaceae bacterium]|nr:AsmA-like C-terminal region-containing protein [Acidobacteriaceae bacterium]